MTAPARLVEVWAADGNRAGRCGSGWIVHDRYVLTARHVLDEFLNAKSAADTAAGLSESDQPVGPVCEVRLANAIGLDDWARCTVAWQHPDRDVALLELTAPGPPGWPAGATEGSTLAALGEKTLEVEAVGFPDASAKPGGLRVPDQPRGWLQPAAGARDDQGRFPFDVATAAPGSEVLWQGISGAALREVDGSGRLVAMVAWTAPDRGRRRLLAVSIEDALGDLARQAPGLEWEPLIEDRQAALWRSCVEPRVLRNSGVPLRVNEVRDLRAFGVRRSALGDTDGAWPAYLRRDRDNDLDAALGEAREGGRRVVLVVGDSAAGKTRSASAAVQRDPVLREWRLVVPMTDGGLARLAAAEIGWADTVVWLDDLDKYLGRGLDLASVGRVLGEERTVVVVATMRAAQLQARQSGLADPAWDFLTNAEQVNEVHLDAFLSDTERRDAATMFSDQALLRALDEGVGLGEWLVAGPELMKRLNRERGPKRAFVDLVVAWNRTGLDQPLAEEDAQRFWNDTLDSGRETRSGETRAQERARLFDEASKWACERFIDPDYDQALVISVDAGYLAHDYVVDQIMRSPQPTAVPDALWDHALQIASDCPPDSQPERLWSVGIAAYNEAAFRHALNAMEPLAQKDVPAALLNTGAVLGRLGRADEAIRVFDEVAARYGDAPEPTRRELVAMALVNEAVMLGRRGRAEDAIAVYDEVEARFGDAAESALRERVAAALVNKAVMLGGLGRVDEAIAVYDEVEARFADAPESALREPVAKALLNKAVMLGGLGRADEAIAVYDEVEARFGDAPESALRALVAAALRNKAVVLGGLGRADEAIAVYDEVEARFADAPEPELREQVATALHNKAVTLGELGRADEAIAVDDEVEARFGDAPEPELREQVAAALYNKAVTLGELGRADEAIAVYDEVEARFADAPEPELRELVASAMHNKGVVLAGMGRADDAIALYDQVEARFADAPEPELREQVAKALLNKAVILGRLGRADDAIALYDQVEARFADAPEPELRAPVATALNNKAVVLGRLGRADEAIAVNDQIEARFADAPEPELREYAVAASQRKRALADGDL